MLGDQLSSLFGDHFSRTEIFLYLKKNLFEEYMVLLHAYTCIHYI
jgi:hypothetical protein